MDKESLERQLNEMEEASDRWRSETRRLNGEIDKLENELADAKAVPERDLDGAAPDKKRPGQPSAPTKSQIAETKVRKAAEWEAERTKLLTQINRLEESVAEAIERASNPLRVTQSIKQRFEVELKQAIQEKTDTEQAFLRAKTQWEQEKLKMTGEMVKLRRAAHMMGQPVMRDGAPEVNPKVRDLERQLKDNHAKWNAEREQLAAQIHKLEETARQWDAERRQLNDHAGQLQQAFVQVQAKLQSYEVAARSPSPAEIQLQDAKRQKEALQRQLMDDRTDWETERRSLGSENEQLKQQLNRVMETTRDRISKEVVDQLRLQYEQKLQETIQQKGQLAQELQSASSLLEAERARLSAAHGKSSGSNMEEKAITAEVSRVQTLLHEIIAVVDNPETGLATVIRKNVEKAELDAYLRGIMFTLSKK